MHCAISLVLIMQTAGQVRSYEQNDAVAVLVLLLVTRCALIAITTSTFWDQTKFRATSLLLRPPLVVKVVQHLTPLATLPCPGNAAL